MANLYISRYTFLVDPKANKVEIKKAVACCQIGIFDYQFNWVHES